jgi:hypothetical protein
VPGKVFLGVSCQDDISTTIARTGRVGLQRTYYQWGDAKRETRNIAADHTAGRMPWISFRAPSGGWRGIAAGTYDADLRTRARRYAALSKPVIVTFNHEPYNDGGAAADFVKAWVRVHDIMKSETGLKNVAHAPILGDWAFNPKNKQTDPELWLPRAVLDRCAFVGTDLYQNAGGQTYVERLGRVITWLDAQGYTDKMVGVGETGCTEGYNSPSAAAWWKESWGFAVANSDRVGAISYFNSLAHNNSGNNWLLWESTAKLAAFKASLIAPAAQATLGASSGTSTTTTTATPVSVRESSSTADVSRSGARATTPKTVTNPRRSRWQWAV